MSTTTFKYRAIDSGGSYCKGAVNALSEQDAFQTLTAQGLVPISLKESSGMAFLIWKKKLTPFEIAMLTREMSVLVEANIPVAQGLMSIGEHDKNPAIRDMVTDIATMIESDEKLTVASSKYESAFGSVYIETLKSAEKTGQIGAVTAHLADMLERNIETNQQIRRALAYPRVAVGFVAMALSVIVIFVVPNFAEIFESNGVELPLTTRVIRVMGDSLTQY